MDFDLCIHFPLCRYSMNIFFEVQAMFVAPKQKTIDTSGKIFASNEIKADTSAVSKIDPSTTLGGGIKSIDNLPIAKDSFFSGLAKGLSQTLANPVTMTTGRDKLALTDPYGKVINSPSNQLVSVLSSYFGEAGAIIGGIASNPDLQKMTGELIKTGKVSSATSKAFLKNFGNGVLSGVSSVGSTVIDQLSKEIGIEGVDGKQLLSSVMGVDGAPRIEDVLSKNPTLSMIIKGKEYYTKGDFSSVDGLFKIVDNITSNTKISNLLDLSTEFQIFNIVTKQLMEFEAPDLFKEVIKYFQTKDTNSDSSVYNRTTEYLLDNVGNAIDTSSVVYMELLLDNVDAYKVLNTNANFVNDFLRSFNLRYDQTPTADMGERLNTLLTRIDKNWSKTQLTPGQGDFVTDLKLFKTLSTDAAMVFSLAGLYTTEMTIANYYPEQSITKYMKELYPLSVL